MTELRTVSPEKTEVKLERGVFQVTPEVIRFNDGFANFYLVQGQSWNAVVDTGFGSPYSMRSIEGIAGRMGGYVNAIIPTHGHPDHVGGVKRLSFSLSARAIETDSRLGEIDLGDRVLQIIPGKGHTQDSRYIYDPKDGVLFSGDNILGDSSADVRYMADYMRGLEDLLEIDPKVICPGHGDPSYNAREDIQELIEHRKTREEQILQEINNGVRTPVKLFWAIYGAQYKSRKQMATDQIKAHLVKLQGEGKVKRTRSGFEIV